MEQTISTLLLNWYDEHKRLLPWRDIRNPYATWVSETMLQQTRVETVVDYYLRFMQRFPDVKALAAAPVEDVLKLWEGLGYYRRARNLWAGAQQVMLEFNGTIPENVEQLKRIKGIGAYTAGAIASIAFGKAVPAVDGNVIRVMSRLYDDHQMMGTASAQRHMDSLVMENIPEDRPGDFNQALMDLGARICVPGTPDCGNCPLRSECLALRHATAEQLPVLPTKAKQKEIRYDLLLITDGDRILMRQRTESLLQGLWVFPMLETKDKPDVLSEQIRKQWKLDVSDLKPAGEAKHVFTHQIWLMKLYAAQATVQPVPQGWKWVTIEEMRQLTIPTAMRGALQAVDTLFHEKNDI